MVIDCQFTSIYGKFVTSQTASFSRVNISAYNKAPIRGWAMFIIYFDLIIINWQQCYTPSGMPGHVSRVIRTSRPDPGPQCQTQCCQRGWWAVQVSSSGSTQRYHYPQTRQIHARPGGIVTSCSMFIVHCSISIWSSPSKTNFDEAICSGVIIIFIVIVLRSFAA